MYPIKPYLYVSIAKVLVHIVKQISYYIVINKCLSSSLGADKPTFNDELVHRCGFRWEWRDELRGRGGSGVRVKRLVAA